MITIKRNNYKYNSSGIIIMSVMMILISGLMFNSCSSKDSDNLQPRSQDIDSVNSIDERTYLKYDWKMIPGDSMEYASPDFDDSSWESIDFPRMGYQMEKKGANYFWLRKTFIISGTLKEELIGYVSGKLPDAGQIFFNGSMIGSSGYMPPHYFSPAMGTRSFLLPEKLINFGDRNVIALRIYTERDSVDLKLGFITNEMDRMNANAIDNNLNVNVPMMLTYFSGLVAAYFLLMFLRNRKELFNLYICLALVFIAIYASLYYVDYPLPYVPALQVWYSSLLLALMFFMFFFQNFYNIHSNWKLQLGFGILGVISCILIFCSRTVPAIFFLVFNVLYLFICAPILIYLLILSILAIIKKNKYAIFLAAGVSIVVLGTVHDMVYAFLKTEPAMMFANTSFVLYILSMFLASAYRFVDTKKEVDKLNFELTLQKNAFFRFVPTQFLNLLDKKSAVDISLGDSAQKSMSVLFSDIRKFTTISEVKSPEESFHLLNSYLFRMEAPINDNDGFVDKYIGDAIMALFAEYITNSSDTKTMTKTSADKAVLAGIGMRVKLEEFNRQQKSERLEALNMGIGINTGPLMLGTVGGIHRLDTTVIGDTVNLASRLEKLTQYYRSSIVISEWSYNSLSQPDSYMIREIDLVIVKGKTTACRIFEVFDADPDETRELKLKTRDIIADGLLKYKGGQFKEALDHFKEAKSIFPKDIIPLLYIKRCVDFIKSPPPPNWTGVFKVHT